MIHNYEFIMRSFLFDVESKNSSFILVININFYLSYLLIIQVFFESMLKKILNVL